MRCAAACFLVLVSVIMMRPQQSAALKHFLCACKQLPIACSACCGLQLSGKLLRCQASVCEFICVSTYKYYLVQYGPAWGGPNEHMRNRAASADQLHQLQSAKSPPRIAHSACAPNIFLRDWPGTGHLLYPEED
jgi:hypothetical protein